jgi:hypothetical protein
MCTMEQTRLKADGPGSRTIHLAERLEASRRAARREGRAIRVPMQNAQDTSESSGLPTTAMHLKVSCAPIPRWNGNVPEMLRGSRWSTLLRTLGSATGL